MVQRPAMVCAKQAAKRLKTVCFVPLTPSEVLTSWTSSQLNRSLLRYMSQPAHWGHIKITLSKHEHLVKHIIFLSPESGMGCVVSRCVVIWPKWVISALVAPKVGFTLRTFTWSPALWDLWAALFTVQQEATITASLHTVKHLLHFLSGSLWVQCLH